MVISCYSKTELRKKAKIIRKSYMDNGSISLCSRKIVSKILSSEEFFNAKNVALYFPINSEIDITNIINVKDKNFYFPRCVDNNLEFVKFTDYKHMIKGQFGIIEPIGEKINPKILDIIYVPALVANKNNYRLGYGKGYYDRFFNQEKISAKKIIIVLDELISSDFVEDKYDFQCDLIISA